jgi:uncharacterized protein (DUF1015 family)
MLRTIRKDLEPVFLIYSDPENVTVNFFKETAKTAPLLEVEDQFRVKHTVWRVTDPKKIAIVQKALADKQLVITDGHHRYESALAYRDERRQQEPWTENSAFNFHMSYMVPVQDEGLAVLPTHRLLRKLELTSSMLELLKEYFTISELTPKVEVLESFLKKHKTKHAFIVYNGTKAHGLLLKDEKKIAELSSENQSAEVSLLDVVILRDVVFKILMKTGNLKLDEDILYERSMLTAIQKVDSGEAKVAFMVNPISPEAVWRIAQKRERLPEKSTDFYPKPVSGLMMMDISREEKL